MSKSISPAEARLLWSILPADCKTAMDKIVAAGRLAESRVEILREAEARLNRLGPTYSNIDAICALELAAEKWLQTHQA